MGDAGGRLVAALAAGALLVASTGACASHAPARLPEAAPAASLREALSRLVWPLRSHERRNVSSAYGYRGRGGGGGRPHYGLDLRARRGEPVHSAGPGRVAEVGDGGAYGRWVRVDHGGQLSSFYAHLDRVLARAGQGVRRGQVIGLAGSTGNATGPHLHFELRWRDRWVDPLAVLPRLE